MDAEAIEQLLHDWREGDASALDKLVPIIYGELRRLARSQLRRDPAARSLQPTMLVHEAYLQLLGARVDWQDRTHFMSVAARVMRRVLVQRARARRRLRRGGDDVRVTFSESIAARYEDRVGVLGLDRALERLYAIDERQARVVELCYFGGLTYPEIGQSLGISEATVHRDLRHARAWLERELSAT